MSLFIPVLISGKQGSGKSTTAEALAEALSGDFCIARYRFAEPLYKLHDVIREEARRLGIPVPDKDGHLLQLLGTDWGRAVYGEDIWIKCALEKAERTRAGNPGRTALIIEDTRFKDELAAFRKFDIRTFAFRLEADRDIRKGRTTSWRSMETHQSEVDLDGAPHLFDQVWNTAHEGVGPKEIARDMARHIFERVVL